MIVQMLIAEMRDRYALAECLEAYTENIGAAAYQSARITRGVPGRRGRRIAPGDRDPLVDVARSGCSLAEWGRP